MLPEYRNRVDCYGCKKEDYYGRTTGDRFLIHKLPRHIMALYGGFELEEKRLKVMQSQGIKLVFIFFHPDVNRTILYRATIEKWLSGQQYINGKEVQRMLPISECEKD